MKFGKNVLQVGLNTHRLAESDFRFAGLLTSSVLTLCSLLWDFGAI